MAGLFQVAILRHALGMGKPDNDAYMVVGRSPIQVDRMQARISVEPKIDGTLPTEDAIKSLERAIRFKLSTDRNETRMITVGEVPISTFQQLQGGPLTIQPIRLNTGEECKVKVSIHPNLLGAGILKDYPAVYLEVLFYGVEA